MRSLLLIREVYATAPKTDRWAGGTFRRLNRLNIRHFWCLPGKTIRLGDKDWRTAATCQGSM